MLFFSSSVNKVQLPHVVNLNVFSCLTFRCSIFVYNIFRLYGIAFEMICLLLAENFSLQLFYLALLLLVHIILVSNADHFVSFLWSVHFDHLDDHISLNLAEMIGFIDFWITHHFRPFSCEDVTKLIKECMCSYHQWSASCSI